MPAQSDLNAELASALAPHGLIPLGAARHEGKPLILIGHAGSSFWPHFSAWRETQPETLANPLDAWSESVIGPIAETLGGEALFPWQKPHHPFQQWAMAATGMKPSPLGILIHPVYGLWHAFRGAILFDADVLIQAPEILNHPCDTCAGKPCLSACPVSAFSSDGYDVAACRAHLVGGAGNECMEGGCLARRACPVGREFMYDDAQMAFHMRAFAGS